LTKNLAGSKRAIERKSSEELLDFLGDDDK